MPVRLKYKKISGLFVTAIKLALETDGFVYRKWGGEQKCKPGDWIVNNEGEVYTVESETFRKTYRAIDTGRYEKISFVWAEIADMYGAIRTKEGFTTYEVGDFLVYNNENGTDGYAIKPEKFHQMYERAVDAVQQAG